MRADAGADGLDRPSRSTVSTRVLIRVGFLSEASTTATLLTWIGASWTTSPPVGCHAHW